MSVDLTLQPKMSTDKKSTPLKHAEIIKKILAEPKIVRSPLEWFDDLGKYRDEHVTEYNQKQAEFLEAADKYSKMNTETMMGHKVMLNCNYEANVDMKFLKEKENSDEEEDECAVFCCCPKCEPNRTGRLLRKRSIRPMQSVPEAFRDVCLMEPWFKRYLILNKFIWAARTVIIQNRLLKVLNQLKTLTLPDVKIITKTVAKKKCEDFHCHPVFEKFL